MKRMFAWKSWLIVSTSLTEAWNALSARVLDNPDERDARGQPASGLCTTMAAYESDNRGFASDEYDKVDPFEYLHAVDPEEVIELGYIDVPPDVAEVVMGAPSGSDQPDFDLYASFAGEAREWATALAIGWIFDRNNPS